MQSGRKDAKVAPTNFIANVSLPNVAFRTWPSPPPLLDGSESIDSRWKSENDLKPGLLKGPSLGPSIFGISPCCLGEYCCDTASEPSLEAEGLRGITYERGSIEAVKNEPEAENP